MKIIASTNQADIVAVTEASAHAKEGIRIIELATMDILMEASKAEAIRSRMLANAVSIKQLTNMPQFTAWTKVQGFVERCMEVRYINPTVVPIHKEVLIFDDTVAIYCTQPTTEVLIMQDADFAAQQRALFDAIWKSATPQVLAEDGSTKATVA